MWSIPPLDPYNYSDASMLLPQYQLVAATVNISVPRKGLEDWMLGGRLNFKFTPPQCDLIGIDHFRLN